MTDFTDAPLAKTARNLLITAVFATLFMIFPLKESCAMDVDALPGGEKVIGGEASFDRSTLGVLTIKQGSDRLLIDWHNGFNIGEKASTTFYQPDSQSIVINRVVGKGDDPTRILGTLSANGRVVILDRNGVIFGKSAKVDVGGLIASTGDIDTNAFLKGSKTLELEQIADGEIRNSGSISIAEAGLAAFVTPSVRNDGLIIARKGSVVMGNAKTVTFDLYGDGLIEVAAGKTVKSSSIQNTGKIDSQTVLLTAVMVDDVVRNLVNIKDIAKSDTFKVKNGSIILGSTRKEETDKKRSQRREDRKKSNELKKEIRAKKREEQKAEPEVIAAIPVVIIEPVPEVIAELPSIETPVAEIPPVEVVAVIEEPAPVPEAVTEIALPTATLKRSIVRLSSSDRVDSPESSTLRNKMGANDYILENFGVLITSGLIKNDLLSISLNTLSPAAGTSDCGKDLAHMGCTFTE